MPTQTKTSEFDSLDLSVVQKVDATYDEVFNLLLEQESYLTSGDNSRPIMNLPAIERMFVINQEMRITARLGAVLAWLMIVRGMAAGEIADDTAMLDEVDPFDLAGCCLNTESHWDQRLPDRLRDLLEQSYEIYVKVIEMDVLFRRTSEVAH